MAENSSDTHSLKNVYESDDDAASMRSLPISEISVPVTKTASHHQKSDKIEDGRHEPHLSIGGQQALLDALNDGGVALAKSPISAGPVQEHNLPQESSEEAEAKSDTGFDTLPPPKRSQSPAPSTRSDLVSISSESQRKLRPESALVSLTKDPLILGIALVDFDHAVGPRIEFSQGSLLDLDHEDGDEEIVKLLPFLALPDGAHLSQEDYTYFHVVPRKSGSSTVFGISCNRQIASSELLVKSEVVTRSTVQKAVVILASKPVFGPIRDKLGVITRALFLQRDFSETAILVDFYLGLEKSLRSQLTESGFYMGTSIRELVHQFRHRTLTLVKALMLERKIVFYGHPVERLCTFQYSLVSLFPGLLQTLDDCGSPPLAARAPTLTRPTELRTSDRKSMLAFLGLPLDLFGKDSFFQPYLPLQQIDLLGSPSYLCGSTNSIVTQHKDIDMLVNIETSQIEFKTPHVERMVALTAADRKWIDDLVKDVNDTWNEEDPQRPLRMQFRGSDDYLRAKFEEYISSALSSIKYRAYRLKDGRSVLAPGETKAGWEDFGELFLTSFNSTNVFEVWDRVTDPILFDLVDPKHPCEARPNLVSDIGLRLQEGLSDLHIEQQLGPTKEVLSSAISAGSTGFFKAVEGVRGGVNRIVAQRQTSSSSSSTGSPGFTFGNPFANFGAGTPSASPAPSSEVSSPPPPPSSFSPPPQGVNGGEPRLRPLSLASVASVTSTTSVNTTSENTASRAASSISSWGFSVGSFIGNKASRLRESVTSISSTSPTAMDPRASVSGASVKSLTLSSEPKTKPYTEPGMEEPLTARPPATPKPAHPSPSPSPQPPSTESPVDFR